MSYGIKVSLPGVDVKSASIKDLSLTSDFASQKGLLFDRVSYTFSGAPNSKQTLVTINHGLGYIPAFWAYFQDKSSNSNRYDMVPYVAQDSDGFFETITLYMDTQDLKFIFESENSSPPDKSGDEFIFKYYVFYDDAD